MKIILSPAKKMKTDTDSVPVQGMPIFIEYTEKILTALKEKTYEELKTIWACNDKIAGENFDRITNMKLSVIGTPAILSYEGIAYKYMAPAVFEKKHLEYLQDHLRILSGFYGILSPMDGVVPYRLEMQAKLSIGQNRDLYEFWGSRIYKSLEDITIINLASKEYSKCIEKYLKPKDKYITVVFCEEHNGKLVTKGTYAKMARGEMVRFMAENNITKPKELQGFNRLGYTYNKERSTDLEYVFERAIK